VASADQKSQAQKQGKAFPKVFALRVCMIWNWQKARRRFWQEKIPKWSSGDRSLKLVTIIIHRQGNRHRIGFYVFITCNIINGDIQRHHRRTKFSRANGEYLKEASEIFYSYDHQFLVERSEKRILSCMDWNSRSWDKIPKHLTNEKIPFSCI